jgi:hypothetical protein
MFSLKLTQISDQNTNTADSNCQTKKEKKSSPLKNFQGTENLLEQAMGIESFIQAQRMTVVLALSQETGSGK